MAACGAGLALPARALAQGAAPAAKPASTVDDGAHLDRARDLMADMQKAVAKLKGFSYTADVQFVSPAASTTATVVGREIDASSWKLYAKGTHTTNEDGKQIVRSFETANDGITSRSIDTEARVVLERADKDRGGVFAFFENFAKDASGAVAWDLLNADKAFASAFFKTPTALEASRTIDGVICDAVAFAMPRGAGGAGEAGDEATSMLRRVFIGREDKLPRRIEVLHVDAQGTTVRGAVLELRQLKVDDKAEGATYALEAPDGFPIRPARLTRTAQSGKQDQADALAGKPVEGVAWRHDPKLLKQGTAAPAFTLKDADGNTVKLSDFKGKVVLLDFWATWCPPCRASMPAVQRVHEKFKDQDVVVIGMNAEGRAGDPVKFKKDNGYTYLSLLKAETTARAYRAQALPTFYVIDKEGKIAWGAMGLARPPGVQNPRMDDVVAHVEGQFTKLIEAELK
jgi:thiol-disulfide isomerase/thioredoxin